MAGVSRSLPLERHLKESGGLEIPPVSVADMARLFSPQRSPVILCCHDTHKCYFIILSPEYHHIASSPLEELFQPSDEPRELMPHHRDLSSSMMESITSSASRIASSASSE